MKDATAAQRGGKNSAEKRRLKQYHRILKVHYLRTVDKMSKADIARKLGVAYETILRDCRTFEGESQVEAEVIERVLEVSRREVLGEITSDQARTEIAGIIEIVANSRADTQ